MNKQLIANEVVEAMSDIGLAITDVGKINLNGWIDQVHVKNPTANDEFIATQVLYWLLKDKRCFVCPSANQISFGGRLRAGRVVKPFVLTVANQILIDKTGKDLEWHKNKAKAEAREWFEDFKQQILK